MRSAQAGIIFYLLGNIQNSRIQLFKTEKTFNKFSSQILKLPNKSLNLEYY